MLFHVLDFDILSCRTRVTVIRLTFSDFAMSVTSEKLLASDCTSCEVLQDKSAYWAPSLYFIHADGRGELVKQVGGMLV